MSWKSPRVSYSVTRTRANIDHFWLVHLDSSAVPETSIVTGSVDYKTDAGFVLQAVDLRAEADSLALEREPGDVQFDEESGEGGTVTVDRERNLALSAQAVLAVEEIDDALTKLDAGRVHG